MRKIIFWACCICAVLDFAMAILILTGIVASTPVASGCAWIWTGAYFLKLAEDNC